MLKPAVPGSVIDRLDESSPRRPLEVEELSLVLKKIGLVNCLKKKSGKGYLLQCQQHVQELSGCTNADNSTCKGLRLYLLVHCHWQCVTSLILEREEVECQGH